MPLRQVNLYFKMMDFYFKKTMNFRFESDEFFVSWKLSMLAFTSIFPVIVITQTYAEWSSRLNLEVNKMNSSLINDEFCINK